MNKAQKVLIIIPTFNEAENIEMLIKEVLVQPVPNEFDVSILIVDDNSPDGTGKIAERLSKEYSGKVYVLNRTEKQGLASAYIAGFRWGFANNYDVFLEMDADFSHNPAYIPSMLTEIKNHDVVIGSRNIKNGGVEGWTILRNTISKGGSLYSRFVLGCPIKDLTGGFNMWRKTALEKIGLDTIISKGYSFQIEMKYKAYLAGCSIKEIPILFVDRKAGKSKMSKSIFMEALTNIWKIRKTNTTHGTASQFIKFFITGGLGTITNLFIFIVLADYLQFYPTPVSVLCFLIAGTQNYIINHTWSFKNTTINEKPSLKKWLLFIIASSFGLLVNITILNIALHLFELPYKFIAQAAGIAAGMIFNFIFSKFIVFRKKR